MAARGCRGGVLFVGLDEVSLELAASLILSGYTVHVSAEAKGSLADEFLNLGGAKLATSKELGTDIAALILLVTNINEANDSITAGKTILGGLSKDTVIILRTSIPPSEAQELEKRLEEDSAFAYVVDAYVSKGVSEVSNGKIMVISSGKSEAISKAEPILSAMCEKMSTFEGDVGAGSKIKMVDELLQGIHFVASVEAISLGAQAEIHPWIIYDIISNAAGSSRIFKDYVPQLLKGEAKLHCLSNLTDSLGATLEVAKMLPFPLPLLAVAHRQLIRVSSSGSSHGIGAEADMPLLKVWENVLGVDIQGPANAELYDPEKLGGQLVAKSANVKQVGFIGLGAMGFGMATHLVKSNFVVKGFDVYQPTLARFVNAGGLTGNSPAEVSQGVEVLVIMVTNEAQAETVLFGDHGAVAALPSGATIVLSSTVSPGFVSQLQRRLQNSTDLKLVDAPVSGGVKRASDGTLTIMASGTDEALVSSCSVLSVLSEKLYVINGGCGAASGVKMVNQLLAGVHIAAAAEAMAFGARLGLGTRKLFDCISNSSGKSWMFENRVPHMLDNDYTPYSALDIFVKDLGIVGRESTSLKIPLHVATAALQLFVAGSAAGWGRQDDAGVVKVYETLTGVKVQGQLPGLKKSDTLKSLPPEWPSDLTDDIRKLNQSNMKTLVVLDDDPTGTQTVHDIEVLTEWSVTSLAEQFRIKPACFFILTNSRSLSSDKAIALMKEICTNLKAAAESVGHSEYTVVLRGDSTLRGHFPEEADAVTSVLGEMDTWILCPFFQQGGRYTIGDVHYVADTDWLIPAGETEFSKDAAFGFTSSNLRQWVEEKTKGRIPASNVTSISIQLLRKGGPAAVCELLCGLPKRSMCIVNAASARDMAVFSAGMIQAELKGKTFLCRTAASFVSSRVGIVPKAPLLPKDLGIQQERKAGLIVVGSYVPKTTKQVEELKLQCGHMLRTIEVSVDKLAMKSSEEREEEISRAAEMADLFIGAQKDTLVMTSRELVVGKSPSESLKINFKVSSALVEIVRRISTKPRYILAKGGITSSDLATKALEAKRAKIVGQALAGVPLWQLGPESRHPGVPYIVFPGNVGDNKAVAEVVKSWAHSSRAFSTKELLLNAEKGGYAVGAFNVYNMEGVEAVIAAAEEERSPAILQIHPGALKHGGLPLVACCISAAEQACVPITLHFDHGTSKQELVNSIELGFNSVMVDASHLPVKDNISYTKLIASIAHAKNMLVEAELGRLSGTEDDLTVEDYEACLTDVNQAEQFINETGIDALAVCIGNVHGKYPASGPNLRLDLLKELYSLSSKKGVFLVLHGASGLPKELVKACIELGVRKFNVNTEVRKAYMDSMAIPKKDLVQLLDSAKEAMKSVVAEKMRLFGSSGKA